MPRGWSSSKRTRSTGARGRSCIYGRLLEQLIEFCKSKPALDNGQGGARMQKVENSAPEQLLSWVRQKDGNKVLGLFIMSDKPVSATPNSGLPVGTYAEFPLRREVTIAEDETIELPAWGWRLFASGSE